MKTIKGFKAFSNGLICNGFQYEVGKDYEHKGTIKLCNSGFHFCENPLNVLDYYDLCESEFGEVEAFGKTKTDDNKTVTDKIRVKAKLSFSEFVKDSVDFVWNKCNEKGIIEKAKDILNKSSSGDSAQLASSGHYAQLASSGNSAKLASSGDSAQLASSGHYAQLASSGDYAQLASSGDSAQLASSGHYAQLASSGNYAKLASSGYSAKLASSGDSAQLASSGNSAKLASSGYSAKLASSGNYAKLASSGYSAQLASSGNYSVVAGIGIDNMAKGKKGNWIVLAEWIYDEKLMRCIPVCVKSVMIDGKKIKEDTWYKLENKKFVEVE